MTAKKTQNVPPTKEEKDEALRAFMYGDIPRPLISMDERYPDLEESDNSVISTGINAVISPTTKEEVQKQETPPKNEQEEEAQPKPVSLPDGKQTPAHRVSSKQRRLSLDEYGTVFLPVPKIDHPKPVFISESLRDELDKVARRLGGKRMSASGIVENMVKHHFGIYGSAARLCFRHPENDLARTPVARGIRSPLVADSVSPVTKVNTLKQ